MECQRKDIPPCRRDREQPHLPGLDLLNLPLIPVWVKVLEVPLPLLYAGILVFATLGVYSLRRAAPSRCS